MARALAGLVTIVTLPGYWSIRLMKMLGSLTTTNRPVPRVPATTTAVSEKPITVVAPSTSASAAGWFVTTSSTPRASG